MAPAAIRDASSANLVEDLVDKALQDRLTLQWPNCRGTVYIVGDIEGLFTNLDVARLAKEGCCHHTAKVGESGRKGGFPAPNASFNRSPPRVSLHAICSSKYLSSV